MASIAKQIIGHKPILKRIQSAVQSERVHSTWLFVGPDGIGKKKLAYAMIQALFCSRPNQGAACGTCTNCHKVESEKSESILLVEPDGAQIKIEQARRVTKFVSLQNWRGARAVIIDQCQKLNMASANALLKTLEEPPENTYFFMIANSLASVLPTIRSRSQVQRVRPLSNEELVRGTGLPEEIAEMAEGRFDRLELVQNSDWKLSRETILGWLKAASKDGAAKVSFFLKDGLKDRESAEAKVQILQYILRDLLRQSLAGGVRARASSVEVHQRSNVDDKFEKSFSELRSRFRPQDLEVLWSEAQQLQRDLAGNVDRVLGFENFFFKVEELGRAAGNHPK